MLSIFFYNHDSGVCNVPYDNYIRTPSSYFNHTRKDEWLETELAKRIVKDVDKSDLVSPSLVISPVLGSIPITDISGGAKTLIMSAFDKDHVFNVSTCGDNCAKWFLEIGKTQDVLICLGHSMHFDLEPFDIKVENTGKIVHTFDEMICEVIDYKLL